MAVDILMPKMGESVQEGTILRWLKQPGESVERDEIIAEISTDKVDTEIPSPAAGVLLEVVAQENQTVGVGEVIARLGAADEVGAPAAPAAPTVPAENPTPVAAAPSEAAPAAPVAEAATPAPATPSTGGTRTEIQMPKMGESVQEGTILRWLKQPGDAVERDEIIAEISTDKVDTEIPSPAAGTLAEIVAQENETVGVGAVIAYLSTGSGAAAGASRPAPQPPKAEAPSTESPKAAAQAVTNATNGATNGTTSITSPAMARETVPSGPVPRTSGGRFYSPLVRSIATAEGIGVAELDRLTGSGQGGRVTKSDILGYVNDRPATPPATAPATAPTTAPATAATPVSRPASTGPKEYGPDVDVVPMDRMRQLIAEHMVRSKQTSPHVTEVGESDVTDLVRLREAEKAAFEKREGIKLTYTPFFIAAVARALRENPWVNSSVDGTNVLVKKRVNVGVATALPDGNLIVPVIKDADRMNITGIAHAVNDLATRARNKTLHPDEIAGGTFTLTNYGVFGLLHGAPIINQPQVAILGTGAIQKRPVVREVLGDDMVVIRSMVYLSLSHDHRVIDGLLGGKFLSDVIRHLESFNATSML
jgi:2-oxoglutarate dehydrogenase E2 component (dihydrolipoamide succinyltransferase)